MFWLWQYSYKKRGTTRGITLTLSVSLVTLLGNPSHRSVLVQIKQTIEQNGKSRREEGISERRQMTNRLQDGRGRQTDFKMERDDRLQDVKWRQTNFRMGGRDWSLGRLTETRSSSKSYSLKETKGAMCSRTGCNRRDLSLTSMINLKCAAVKETFPLLKLETCS